MFAVSRSNTLRYDPRLCVGCGRCEEVCPHAVFVMENKLALLDRPHDCIECGACRLNCPTDAFAVDSGTGCAWALMREAVTGRSRACEC